MTYLLSSETLSLHNTRLVLFFKFQIGYYPNLFDNFLVSVQLGQPADFIYP